MSGLGSDCEIKFLPCATDLAGCACSAAEVKATGRVRISAWLAPSASATRPCLALRHPKSERQNPKSIYKGCSVGLNILQGRKGRDNGPRCAYSSRLEKGFQRTGLIIRLFECTLKVAACPMSKLVERCIMIGLDPLPPLSGRRPCRRGSLGAADRGLYAYGGQRVGLGPG